MRKQGLADDCLHVVLTPLFIISVVCLGWLMAITRDSIRPNRLNALFKKALRWRVTGDSIT